jgi:thiosulfate/3-mercaptopyruvate sulfurtransferase
MRHVLMVLVWVGSLVCMAACGNSRGREAGLPLVQPAELAKVLRGATDKPLLFHVGFRKLYQQAHIPGSEFFGPTSESAAVQKLRKRAESLPRNTPIVVYCGCCPWERCPNVTPAYEALHAMGFVNVRLLYIAQDLGADWAAKGYPIEKGDGP